MTELSVVVPATDGPVTLERCRQALAAAHGSHELIVVDGPSSLSASAARNEGASRASGDVVVFVDADVEVHPDALERIAAAFEADPDLTAVHGSYDDRPRVRSTVSAFRNLLHHHVHQTEGAGPSDTFWSGLGAVRRDAFLAVGGFDGDRYPMPSIEDIELGHRLVAAGGRLRLDPAIQGTHLKHWTLRTMLWTDFARRGVPWVALQLRSRRVSRSLNCGWRHRLSALAALVVLVALGVGAPLAAVAGIGGLVALNHAFYALLLRRLGPLAAVAGVGLHGLHHLVSIAAVPVGIGAGLLSLGGSRTVLPLADVDPAAGAL